MMTDARCLTDVNFVFGILHPTSSFISSFLIACLSMNADYRNQHSSVEHYRVFIQKWQLLVRGKAAQGFSPQT